MSMPKICPAACEDGNASMEPTAGNTPASKTETTPGGSPSAGAPANGPTLAAWPRLDLGAVLRPLTPEDDLLGEMLSHHDSGLGQSDGEGEIRRL